MNYIDKYNAWLNEETFDDQTKRELQAIEGNDKEIEDRFYKDLEFGTAGLRGVIGAGTNRMNRYTVTKATQGLANYIIKQGGQDKGVVIAFDSRHMSPEFSKWAALCLNANGIKTYRFNTLRPTPELSFAIRELGCIAGIVITASHNPPEYNGYKAYWEDGAQIVAPRDKEIIEEVKKVESYSEIKTITLQEAVNKGLYNTVGKEIDDRYIEELKKLVLNPEIVKEQGKDLKIVYTPLHGTGNVPVQRILNELGFENVYVVKEQELPDGNFPTVSYPNPEDPKAFELALSLAKEADADRLGIFAKDTKTGEYINYTGNMSALLIAEYELSQRKEKGTLPKNGAFISTIVSSDLAKAIAKWYEVELIEVLTGFKYIGEQIKLFEQNKDKEYVFGFEESYGCLVGTHARDKDAIVAVMALCEAAAYYKSKGLTLWDQMNEIYKKYGYYKETQVSITMKGIEGAEKIKQMLADFRENPPKKFGKYNVIAIRDYDSGIIKFADGTEGKTNLPKSNVLYYELEDNAWCCVRPSGTEPKIKFYIGVKEDTNDKAIKELEKIKQEMMKLAE